MSECHSCPHSRDKKLRLKQFEKTPCATCKLSETNHKGQSFVSRDSSEVVDVEECIAQVNREEEHQDKRLQLLADFLKQFMSLPPITRDIVAAKFVDPKRPLAIMAKRYGISVQAVHSRLKRAIERFPVLSEVITMRTATTGESNK